MCGGQRKDGKGEVGRVMGFSKQHIVHHPKRKGFKARSLAYARLAECVRGRSIEQGGSMLLQASPSQYSAVILGK